MDVLFSSINGSNGYEMTHFKLTHLELKQANEFVNNLHRHHKPVQGHRFSIGASLNEILIGIAIIGRPVSREIDHKSVVEVSRLCTNGIPNACSFLYAASAKASKALGYSRIQTYILDSEPGTSLIAAGWIFDGMVKGRNWNNSWDRIGTRREDQPMCDKQRWIKNL